MWNEIDTPLSVTVVAVVLTVAWLVFLAVGWIAPIFDALFG